MKKVTILFFLVVLVLGNSACSKNDSGFANTSQVVTIGTWHVSQFTDSGNDETSHFAGYSFTFGSNGMLSATNGTLSKTGSWSLSDNSAKFNIDLGSKSSSNIPFGELTDDWKILSSTSTQIRLGDDNAASNEVLIFTKN